MKTNFKHILVFLPMLILGSVLSFAQKPLLSPAANTKELQDISLISPANTSRGVQLNQSIDYAVQVLGQPCHISDMYFEIDEVTAKVYHYGKNKLYFVKNKLEGWDLVDQSIIVGKPNNQASFFKIGDQYTPATSTVPAGSVPSRNPGTATFSSTFKDFDLIPTVYKKDADAKKVFFRISLKKDATLLDSYVILQFNANRDLVNISMRKP